MAEKEEVIRFDKGERVLCYEPDNSKAKVLYDSKILGIYESKDKNGCRVVEYKVHFQGWNNKWDRKLGPEFLLKDTEENRQLQKDLAETAHVHITNAHSYKDRNADEQTKTKKHRSRKSGPAATTTTQPEPVVAAAAAAESSDVATTSSTTTNPSADVSPSSKGATKRTINPIKTNLPSGKAIVTIRAEDYKKMKVRKEELTAKFDYKKDVYDSFLHDDDEIDDNVPSTSQRAIAQQAKQKPKAQSQPQPQPQTPQQKQPQPQKQPQKQPQQPKQQPKQRQAQPRGRAQQQPVAVQAPIREERVVLRISESLRQYLEYDYDMIVKYGSQHILPSRTNVITILEDFVRQRTTELVLGVKSDSTRARSTQRRTGKMEKEYDKAIITAGLLKEVADGLRIYFDFTITDYLLYKEDRSYSLTYLTKEKLIAGAERFWSRATPIDYEKQLDEYITIMDSEEPTTSGAASKPGPAYYTAKYYLPTEMKKFLKEIFDWRLLQPDSPPSPSMIFGATHLARLLVKLPEFLNATTMSDEKLQALVAHLDTFTNYLESHKGWFNENNYTVFAEKRRSYDRKREAANNQPEEEQELSASFRTHMTVSKEPK